jgi:hypothetical protein
LRQNQRKRKENLANSETKNSKTERMDQEAKIHSMKYIICLKKTTKIYKNVCLNECAKILIIKKA